MRILFCNYEYPPLGGGGGVINARLAESLADRHSVTVLTSRGRNTARHEIVEGVRVVRATVLGRKVAAAANMLSMASYLPSGAWRGRSLVREERFDIINTHFVVPTGPVGAYLAAFAGIPNVLTVHGGDLYDPSKASSPHRHWFLRSVIRRMLRRADAVVGQSANTISNVHEFFAADQPCRLIPLGIPRPRQVAANRQALGFGDDEKILVTVGRLVSRKAVDQLIRMMPTFEGQNARLVIIGDGPPMAKLKAQADTAGVARSTTFSGFVSEDEKAAILQSADLYVSTSQHEGFGLVFLEAMAAGLPVICYDFGGQSDFLEDEKTGGLIPLNDEKAFADCVSRFLQDEVASADASEENLRRVEKYFIDSCARQYEALFEEIIADR